MEQAVCRKCGIPRDALGSVQIVRKAVDARKKNDICLNYHVLAEVETGGRQAKRLLAEGTEPIHVISARLGFGDQFYFNKFFKKHVGLPPHRYRKANAEKKGSLSIVGVEKI